MEIAQISNVAGRMIESPYRLGAMAPGEGFDCLSYLVFFYRELGVKLPARHRQYTLGNYAVEFRKDPARAKEALYRFLKRFGEPVENHAFMQPGDLCLIKGIEKPISTLLPGRDLVSAIYVGAGNLMSCDRRAGIVIFPKHKIATEITEVRRPCRNPRR